MNYNECLFVAIGEGAGKLIDELVNRNKKYVSLFINTNYQDVRKLKNAKNIYVPAGNAKGSGRSRTKAKEYAKEYYQEMINAIMDFHLQKNIFVCYSMDGGSGSGIAPVILRMLIKMNEERNLGKKINSISILPKFDVSKEGLSNTIDCWNETLAIKGINSMYFIDNNKRDALQEINIEFSKLFDNAMKIPNQIGEGTMIDSSDLEKIMLAKGCNAIYELPINEEDTKVATIKSIKNSIFADFNTIKCTHILTSFNQFNHKEVRNEFQAREEYLEGYNNSTNIIVAGGFRPPINSIEYIQMELQERLSRIDKNEEDFSSYIVKNESITTNAKPQPKKAEPIKQELQPQEDLDKIFDDSFWEDIF